MDFYKQSHCVIVGLGNPGQRYEVTRHNIGWLAAKQLVEEFGFSFKEEKQFQALVAKGKWQEKTLHILLPQTYMNLSGFAVGKYLDFYKINDKGLVVISDDVELPFGQLRIRLRGGSGGHNGLKSIESHLGKREYLRLKMGIGKNVANATLADYVLDPFNEEERANLKSFILQGAEVIVSLLNEPVAAVMNRINRSNS